MYCSKCGVSVEENGGTQLTDCYHFLCLECLQKAVEATNVPGVRCEMIQGFYQCDGYVDHEELEFMVSETVYAEYVERICNDVGENEDNSSLDSSDNDGAAGNSYAKNNHSKEKLKLTEEELQYGWAHKIMAIDELIKTQGLSGNEAEDVFDKLPVWENKALISCTICMDDEVASGEGVVLKECFHMFCKGCLANLVEHNDEADVKCPYIDGNYSCIYHLQPREIRHLVADAVYEKYLEKSLKLGESSMENSFHCKTPDCSGWCVFDEGVTRFDCPLCRKPNCIKCQVIHDGTCEDYKNRIQQNQNDKMSEEALETRLQSSPQLIRQGEYMRCPKCKIPVQKVIGCDWLQCTCCKTEICWVTRGPRWGPKGRGDTSGGCRCRANPTKALCHPNCGNCH